MNYRVRDYCCRFQERYDRSLAQAGRLLALGWDWQRRGRMQIAPLPDERVPVDDVG